MSVLLGQGGMSFASPRDFSVGGCDNVAIGDLSGDLSLDIVGANFSNISLLLSIP